MDSLSPQVEAPERIPPAKVKYDPVARSYEDAGFPPATDVKEKGRVECMCCHAWLPFDRFENLTDPFCYECRHKHAESELQELKARMCQKFTDGLEDAASGRMPLEHIRDVMAELFYDFGGMRVFVKCWSDQLKAAFEKNPGSATNLRAAGAIAKLVMDCNKLQHQENLMDLTDEQLRFEKDMALLEMLNTAAVDPRRKRLLVELMRVNGIQLSEIPGIAMEEVADGG